MATGRGKKNKPTKPEKQEIVYTNKKSLKEQFSGLDRNDPGLWPLLPRLVMYAGLAAAVLVIAWFLFLGGVYGKLDRYKRDEGRLKEAFIEKQGMARNLEQLKAQQLLVSEYVAQLEAKLPNEALIDQLLNEVTRAGEDNNLTVEELSSQNIIVQDYYAEQPIVVDMVGKSYHDFGRFAQALGEMERIVTLDNITLAPVDPSVGEASGVRLTGTLKTYRYMSQEDQDKHRQASSVRR